MSAEEQEAESMGCMVLVMGWLFTLMGGIALGYWVLR